MPIIPKQKKPNTPHKKDSVWKKDIYDIVAPGRKYKVSIAQLALFCSNAAYLFGAGLPVKAVLSILQGQNLGPSLNSAVSQIHTHVMKGAGFSYALQREGIFPAFMVGYIAIGEKTAQLANVCEKLADYYEQRSQTRKELFAALMYPMTVLVMMLGVIMLAMATVLPGYADIFAASDIALPGVTEILLAWSAFMISNALSIFGGIFVVVVLFLLFCRSKQGRLTVAQVVLKIPILRLGINFHLSQALSLLLASGIKISDAVPLCIDLVDNICVKQDLLRLSQNMAQGMAFSVALAKIQYVYPIFCDLANVGEKSGDLPATMDKCNSYFASSYKHNISRLNKLVEPLITLFMGAMLAFLMLAVVLPTFQLATVM